MNRNFCSKVLFVNLIFLYGMEHKAVKASYHDVSSPGTSASSPHSGIKRKRTVEVHVTFGSSKKVIKTSPENFDLDVKSYFSIKDEYLLVQKYNKKWDDWEDISPSSISDGCKLRIEATIKPLPVQPSKKSELPDEPSQKKVKQELSSLSNFRLPKFPSNLRKILKSKGELSKSDMGDFVLELFFEIKKFTYFPQPKEIEYVVDMFFKKYPLVPEGCALKLAKAFCSKKLQTCFVKFGRKEAMKANNGHQRAKQQNRPQRANKVTRDQETQTAHRKTAYEDMSDVMEEMKEEWLKPERDMKLIQEFMKVTYQKRRNFVVNEHPAVHTLKEIYPALFHAEEIKREFWRIAGKNSSDTFHNNLKKFYPVIFNMKGVDKEIRMQILFERQRGKNLDDRIISLLLLPSLLDENLSFVCLEDEDFDRERELCWIDCNASLNEIITGKGIFKIYGENHLLCEPRDFIEAVECFVACFFAINLEYNQECYKTLQILQAFFMEVEEDEETATPLNQQVVKLVDRLKENLNQMMFSGERELHNCSVSM